MSFHPVASLIKGIRVLEVTNEFGPIGLSQVCRITNLPKATTFRMLETLKSEGYIDFDGDKKTYSIAVRSLALSNKFSPNEFLLRTAAPIMKILRRELGWPSDLAIFQHDKMVIVETNRLPGALSTNRTVGSRVPILASATGRSYLAFSSEAVQQHILNALNYSEDKYERLAKDPDKVAKILKKTVKNGYGISNREFLPVNLSAAVPVIVKDKVVCCINVITLANMVTLKELKKKYVPLLQKAKRQLESKLQQGI